jgi:UDP-N-acetylglucosamine/UDP-N-acetyl-alpha-D-glucosaminouronate 4-epimerase
MSTYFITGGAGFIGSHIVDELVRRGEKVRVLDNFSTGKRENLSLAIGRAPDAVDVIQADIQDRGAVQRAMQGVDYALHQAALASVAQSVADPLQTNQVNVAGTLNVLLAARDAGVKRVVFAGSCAVYGNNDSLPLRETDTPQPLSPYAASKLAGEGYCRAFLEAYGLPTVVLRYFNVFGPRQDPTSEYSAVIPKFITALLRDQPPTIYGDGTQSRDFVSVANVVRANLLACEREQAIGQVINVGCGEHYTLLDLHDQLVDLTHKNLLPVFAPARMGEVKHSQAAIDTATQMLGYKPETTWQEGLRRTVAWYADHIA